MERSRKEAMVLDVLATQRKGKRIMMYGLAALLALWLVLAITDRKTLIFATIPLCFVLVLIQNWYLKKARRLAHSYALALKADQARKQRRKGNPCR